MLLLDVFRKGAPQFRYGFLRGLVPHEIKCPQAMRAKTMEWLETT